MEKYPGLVKSTFLPFGLNWKRSDHVVILTYDSVSHTFGFITQKMLRVALEDVSVGFGLNPPVAMATGVIKSLISKKGRKWRDINPNFTYCGTAHYNYQRRHYVQVSGKNFAILTGAGYQTFEVGGDLVKVLGDKNGPAFSEILSKYPLMQQMGSKAAMG